MGIIRFGVNKNIVDETENEIKNLDLQAHETVFSDEVEFSLADISRDDVCILLGNLTECGIEPTIKAFIFND